MEVSKMKGSKNFGKIFRGMVISALALILIVPTASIAVDKLIVKDSAGNMKFSARDDGSVMLNTSTFDGPTWAKLYGAAEGDLAGIALDSYGSVATMGGGGMFRFARGTQAAKTAVQSGDRLGFFVFSAYDGTAFYNTAALTAKIDNAVSTGNVPTKLVFETTATTAANRAERMAISSSGNVGIGLTSTTPPAYPLHMVNSGAYVTTGGVWTNASSRDYKEDIEALSTKEALETLEGLNPVKYAYKKDKDEKHIGFIAEDVPELVATKDRKGLSPMDIVAVLTKVVQEQKRTITELSGKVDSMQQEINRVKGMNIVGSIGKSIK
jgi:hypothetical protein